jgi:cell division septum initiation protein DivIVA
MERQPPEEEKEDLEEHIKMLKEEIAAAEERLEKLGKVK